MSITFDTNPYPASTTTVTFGHDGTDGSVKTGSGKLILSSSTKVIHVSSSLNFGIVPELQYHITSVNSHLVLSSSAGSAVSVSGNLRFPVAHVAGIGHITATTSPLVLSSSAGTVYISGALAFSINGTSTSNIYRQSNGVLTIAESSGISVSNAQTNSSTITLTAAGTTITLAPSPPKISSTATDLILSASTNVTVLSSSLDFESTIKSYHVNSRLSHLILSSSAGSSVSVSGGLKLYNATTASFTAPQTGMIMWHTTANCMALYNGVSWFRLASGTTI